MRFNTRFITHAATIAALYAALTLLAQPVSFGYGGMFQLRIAEALTILPVLTPSAVPGLALGCFAANLLGGGTVLDIVFGPVATLLAAILARKLRKKVLVASLMPTVFNSLIVGAVLFFASEGLPYPMAVLTVAPGELCAATGLGWIVYKATEHIPLLEEKP